MKKFNPGGFMVNMIFALFIMAAFNVAALPAIGGTMLAGAAKSIVKSNSFSFQAGVSKEIWTDILMEGFYPNSNFLSEGRDMSQFVEYNNINLAEAGANPSVLIDNTSYPIAVSSRTDVPKSLALKTLDTTSTVVRNVEKMESSYDKMSSVIYGHKQELLKVAGQLAGWNWTPLSDATLTPVIAASGALTNGYRKLTFDDVLKLMVRFNNANISPDGRVLVLTPQHEADLIAADLTLYKAAIMNGTLFGFKLYVSTLTPTFNAGTGVKCAYGAVAVPATDTYSSFAFQKDEVMKAMGDVDMFAKYADPDNKGDVINFQIRFVALSLRTKAIAALYSPRA